VAKVNTKDEVLGRLRSLSNPKALAGMTRFGINPKNTYGVSIPIVRSIAKEVGRNHLLAQQLWLSGIHEARILASMIDDPKMVTEDQMEKWATGFDSWGVCDQCCGNLFDKTEIAYRKAVEWSGRNEEFVKRAGFVLMAELAVHDKTGEDRDFLKFLSIIEKHPEDDRNFVKKAVNWALRQIGKRNLLLNKAAIRVSQRIQQRDSRAARWIASDALRELTSKAAQNRLRS
jgi:3-methyladenine DNA glycosylase AlkD